MRARIEKAPSGRSRCRRCGKTIAKGEYRFLQNENAFHLACSTGLAGFDAHAAAKLTRASAPATAAPAPASPGELETALVADPSDEARRVYADALVAAGDPWGEILALYQANETVKADKLLAKHRKVLLGGHSPKLFTWAKGFITDAKLDRKTETTALPQLEEVLALRATVLLGAVSLDTWLTAPIARVLSRRPTLRSLRVLFGGKASATAFGALALPRLESLQIFLDRQPQPGQLDGLFATTKLPSLRALEMWTRSSPGLHLEPEIVDTLIASPLLRQLRVLRLRQGALLDDGLARFEGVAIPGLELRVSTWP